MTESIEVQRASTRSLISSTGRKRIERVVRAVDLFGVTVSGLTIVALMMLTVLDVGMRQFGHRGIRGTIEWTEFLLVFAVYLGMATAESRRAHIRSPLVTNLLPSTWAHSLRAFAQLLVACFLIWLSVQTYLEAMGAFDRGELKVGVVEVPVWPAKLIIPVGLLLFASVVVARCVLIVDDLRRGAPARHEEFEGLP